jgi:hypothetical protein
MNSKKLDKEIEQWREMVVCHVPPRGRSLESLADALQRRFQQSGNSEDIKRYLNCTESC